MSYFSYCCTPRFEMYKVKPDLRLNFLYKLQILLVVLDRRETNPTFTK
jgi:hypothetical protein